MNLVRRFGCIAFVLLLIGSCLASGPGEDWLPITEKDRQVKDVPGDPGASAIQLYYANRINDNDHSEFLYHRIKVLNDKGRSYGSVEILLAPESSFHDLQARTIHPDGKIIEFAGRSFEKTVVKGKGI